jgi:UDP-N-acetyl-D-mannosaminuronate dehydrogenase
MFERISMIGLGYIGLPTATMFASRKKHVIGVDVNQFAVDNINQGTGHHRENSSRGFEWWIQGRSATKLNPVMGG